MIIYNIEEIKNHIINKGKEDKKMEDEEERE